MKKFLKALTAIFAVAILAFAIVGCGSVSVSGKTYVGSDVKVSYSSEVSEEVKTEMDAMVESMKESVKLEKYTFAEDGNVVVMGVNTGMKWTQEGNKVTVTSPGGSITELTVNGNKLESSETQNGVTVTTIMVKE